MSDHDSADLLHVFLASPGDVGEEREFVRHYLESTLPKARFLPRPIAIDVVSWDHPAASVPMPAHLTPQEAVIRFKIAPADCDIVIVILWGRLGTHLDPVALVRPDGSRFLSGTEWEYENAFNANPRPDILVYQRMDQPKIDLRSPSRAEVLDQLDRVDAFVGRFKNADGSWKGGFTQYTGLDVFKTKLANDLEHIVAERMKKPPAQSAPTQTLPEPVAAIPLPDRCYGRDADTDAVVAALVAETPPVAVLVQGPGGIGKTTLTQQAANHDTVIAKFGARRWFVELETATDRDTFDAAILQALGLDATLGFDAALNRLAQARSLLVWDNLETPWGDDTLAVEQRLARFAAVPGLALLASFRGDESVGGARWSLRHTVHPLSRSDAEALFLDIAPSIRPNDPHLSALLAALGGVPLAICLTARRAARHDALAELWTEWRAAGTALAQLPGAAPGRLTSVPHSIEFSLRSSRLTEPGRRLFRLLGQLPAGIAEEDRRALLAGDAFTAHGELLAVGLAVRRDGRLDLLPPVRDHARRAHPPTGEDAEWFRHYLALTADLGPHAGREGGAEAIERLVPELPNIEAAFDAAVAGGSLEPAVAARYGLAETIQFSGLGSARALESLAAACASVGDALGEANCIRSLGHIALARSDHDTARSRYEEALPLSRNAGDVVGEANCIWRLGDIALARSDHDAARSRYEEALKLFRRVGAVLGEANCIKSLGDIALRRSDHDAARSRYEEALKLFRHAGDVLGAANCIQRLGDIALRRSDHDAARSRCEEALTLYRRAGNVLGEANCIQGLGDIALARSDHDAARSCYEEALPLFRRVGDVFGEANCIQGLGNIALARSDHDAARSRYEEALPLYARVGDVVGEANSIKSLGDIALARSDHDAARARYEAALPLYRHVGSILGEATCIRSLGDIALARSDHDAARSRYEEALPLYRHVGSVLGEANCIQSLGDIALRHSNHDAARARYEETLPLYRRAGSVLGEANCIRSLGDIALARSDHAVARSRYEEALPLYRRAGSVLGEANCIRSLGDIARARSNHAAARMCYEEALPLYRRVGSLLGEANCMLRLGDIALVGRSDLDIAHARYEEALPLYRRVGDERGQANCFLGFGDVADALEDRVTAQDCFQTALILFQNIHDVYSTALTHERLANVTAEETRAVHILAAKQLWTAIGLPDAAELKTEADADIFAPREAGDGI